jgi:hypothetical protein
MSNYVNADAGKGGDKHQEVVGGRTPHDLKDRVGAKFGNEHEVNPAYARGGSGSKGNPGKPV